MNDPGGATPVRIFVGVKIAPEITRELGRLAAELEGPSVRLVSPTDMHLTLVPQWHESCCSRAVEKLRDVTGKFGPFPLGLQHVDYGPEPKRPKLLWVDCAATLEITALRWALLQAYARTDERPFRPHITLARIRGSGSAFARNHPIDQPLSLTQLVQTIELFRSPPPGASGYRILTRAQLSAIAHPAKR